MFKSKKSIRIHLLALGMAGVLHGADSHPYQIEITAGNGGHYLQGQPAHAVVTIRTSSDKEAPWVGDYGLWYYKGATCQKMMVMDYPAIPLKERTRKTEPDPKVAANWQKTREYDLAQTCPIAEPGRYDLEYRFGNIAHPEAAQPARITIVVEAPAGEEITANEEHQRCVALANDSHNPMHFKNIQDEQEFRWNCNTKVIENHPTTMTAGWLLFERDSGFIPDEGAGGAKLLDDILHPFYTGNPALVSGLERQPDGRDVIKDPRKVADQYVPPAEKFVAAHPDSEIAPLIWVHLAMGYMAQKRYQEAYHAIQKSLEVKWPEWYYQHQWSAPPDRYYRWRRNLAELKEELVKQRLAKAQ